MILLLALGGCEPGPAWTAADPSAGAGDEGVVPDDGTVPEADCVSASIRSPGGTIDAKDAVLTVAQGTFSAAEVVALCRVAAPDADPLSDGWEVRFDPPAGPAVPLQIRIRAPSESTGAVFVPAPDGDRVRALQAVTRDGWWEAPVHRAGLVSVAHDERALVPFEGRPTAADLLFLVDNSCSMLDEQQKLGNRLPDHLLAVLEAARVDYRLAVVPTDHENAAEESVLSNTGGFGWIEPGTPNRDEVLADLVQVGTSGSQDDQPGLEAVSRTLSSDVLDSANGGFLRPDASLAVVVVSHRDDHSAMTPEELAEELLGQMPDRPSVAFHSLVYTDGADRGTKYIAVSHQVGGIVADLVESDWNRYFESLALATAEPGAMPVPTAELPEVWWVWPGDREPEQVPEEQVLWEDGLLFGVRGTEPEAETWVLYEP